MPDPTTLESFASHRTVRHIQTGLFALAVVSLVCITSSAQTPQQSSPSAPATQSVALEVLALDKNHQPITDMKPEDFHLTINKHEVNVDSAQLAASAPLNFVLLFDVSGSRRTDPKLRTEFMAANDFLRRAWQVGDVASVVSFNDVPFTETPPTSDLDAIAQGLGSLARLRIGGSSSVYDALCFVAQNRNSPPLAHRVVLLFSDFDDDSSRATPESSVDCAWKGKTKIYSFVLLDDKSPEKTTRHNLKVADGLSAQSGGLSFAPESPSDLSGSLTQLSQLIRSTYEISFVPPPAKSTKHPTSIDIKSSRPGVQLFFAKSFYQQ